MVSVSSGLPCLDPGEGARHELVVDGFLDQRAARAGAHLALVEGEQDEALDGLVEEGVVQPIDAALRLAAEHGVGVPPQVEVPVVVVVRPALLPDQNGRVGHRPVSYASAVPAVTDHFSLPAEVAAGRMRLTEKRIHA